jgi:DNA-binding transcriptional MerR regulator
MEHKFLLASEAGRVAGCSAQNIKAMEKSGRLKALRTLGGVRLFSETDIRELAAQRNAAKRDNRKKI